MVTSPLAAAVYTVTPTHTNFLQDGAAFTVEIATYTNFVTGCTYAAPFVAMRVGVASSSVPQCTNTAIVMTYTSSAALPAGLTIQ